MSLRSPTYPDHPRPPMPPGPPAGDPLQGAADWLKTAIVDCTVADLQSRLLIGYNRASRLFGVVHVTEPKRVYADLCIPGAPYFAAMSATKPTEAPPAGESLARRFHTLYETLAPQFGYETRPETRAFDPASTNGKLMIAVCAALASPVSAPQPKEM